MKKYLVHVIWFIAVIVAFVGGIYYSQTTTQTTMNGQGNANASSTRRFGGRGGAGGGFAAGQILSKDSQSITVQLPNGNSEVVFYSSSTQVIKPSPASVKDLTPGTNITVGGTQNADGSVTAQMIQIREGSLGIGFGPQSSGTGQ